MDGYYPISFYNWIAVPAVLTGSFGCEQILPSPTTGTFPSQAFNWKTHSANPQQGIKEESRAYSDFSFQPHTKPMNSQFTSFQSSSAAVSTVLVLISSYRFSI